MEYKRITKKPEDIVYSLGITFFEEQIPNGRDSLFNAIKSIASEQFHIICMYHYKPKAKRKPHYHIAVRMGNSKPRKSASYILKLLGIVFRPGIDDSLLKHEALETCGNYDSYVKYMMHRTPEAKQLGKEEYDENDLITNLTPSELQKVLGGCNITKKELSSAGLSNIIDKARTAGFNLESYNSFIDSFQILGLTQTAENKIKKSYETGVRRRINQNPALNRIIVEIEVPQGANTENKERIVNAIHTVLIEKDLNYIYENEYNFFLDTEVTPFNDAIFLLISDASSFINKINNIKLDDSNICVYKPELSNKKNIWCGKYLLFVHDYIDHSKFDAKGNPSFKLLSSSLFCEIKNDELKCTHSPNINYSTEECEFITTEFRSFREKFNLAMTQTKVSERGALSLDLLNS